MTNKGKGKSKKPGKAHKQPKSKNNDPYNDVINTDMSIWGEKNIEVLDKKLRVEVENLFEHVLNELVSVGYKNEVAHNAIVLNGHVFHGTSLFNSIKNNSIAFINEGRIDQECLISEHVPTTWKERISDLQELLVFLAQRAHPNWTKFDAMKFLIATQLQVDPPKSTNFLSSREKISRSLRQCQCSKHPRVEYKISQLGENHNCSGNSSIGEHGSSSGTSDSNTNTSSIDLLKKVNLTPALEAHLEENVSKFVAAFQREMEESLTNSPHLLDSLQIDELKRINNCKEEEDEKYLNLIEAWLDYEPDHPKNHLIMSTVSYTRELRKQLKERKEWANKKFIQAAQRLGYILLELKLLKLECSVSESKMFKNKQRLEDEFLDMKICQKEDVLKILSIQLERDNEHMRSLELMSSTCRANIEASKLNYTEYRVKGLEFVKMEKKHSKRVMALEKLCSELEEQLVEDKEKEIDLREEAIQVKKAIQEDEINLRDELKRPELISTRVSEENKSNKTVEDDMKRNQAMLRQKLEIDVQLMKDDKQRLEEELANRRRSGDSSHLLFEGTSRTHLFDANIITDTIPLELHTLQDSSPKKDFKSRKCVACLKSESFVLFLPCAHQVTCLNCNKLSSFGGMCPCCKVPIEEKICVYGSSP
ncbi:hypothetical protein LguiB_020913 [Lonicera macranthoides]